MSEQVSDPCVRQWVEQVPLGFLPWPLSHTPASGHILNTQDYPSSSAHKHLFTCLHQADLPGQPRTGSDSSLSAGPSQPEPRRRPVNYCWMNERRAKNTRAFVELGWPFWERPGAILRGGGGVSDGPWHSPTRVQILPWVQLPASSARQWDRILAVPTALDLGPSLGNIGSDWWNGGPGSSRKLPLPLPRQEVKNNSLVFVPPARGPLLHFLLLSSCGTVG